MLAAAWVRPALAFAEAGSDVAITDVDSEGLDDKWHG